MKLLSGPGMRGVTLKAFLIVLTEVLGVFAFTSLLRLAFFAFGKSGIYVDLRLHSVIEAVGAMAALVNAALLIQAVRYHRRNASYVWLSCSAVVLACSGLIQAILPANTNAMVWLECVSALLAGSLALLSMVRSPWMVTPSRANGTLLVTCAITLLSGVLSATFSSSLPLMVVEGRFTPMAFTLGALSFGTFVAAAVGLLSRGQEYRQNEDTHLASYCLFSGVSTMYVSGYYAWGLVWWFGHLTQFVGHLAVLSLIARWVMRMNREVLESERRLKLLAEASYEAAVIAVEDRIIDVNHAFTDMTGYTRSEVVGRRLTDFISDDYRKHPKERQHGHNRQPIQREIVAVRRDNSIAFVEVRERSIKTADRSFDVMLLRDKTDRRTIELGLEELAASGHFLLHHLGLANRLPNLGVARPALAAEGVEGASVPIGPTVSTSRGLDAVMRQAHRIVRSTDGLLQYSRARGKQTHQKPCSSASAVSTALAQLETELRALSVQTEVGDLPVVVADDALLLGLFRNLIEALIRGSDPERPHQVRIHAERREERWRFCFARDEHPDEALIDPDPDPLIDVVSRELASRIGGTLELEKDRYGLHRAYFSLPYFQWITVRR